MRIHARLFALALAALGVTLTGCDTVRQALGADGRGGPSELSQSTDETDDCSACAKFKARPPVGLNAPPVL